METNLLSVEFTDDGFAILRLTNGENRFNLTSVRAINRALDVVEGKNECKAYISTGEGKFYSNGIDLNWAMTADPTHVTTFNKELVDLFWRVMHFPIPTVAAVNGHAFAGGAFLAMSHDYRVMRADRGWITWNETHLKVPFGAPLLEVLKTKVSGTALRESVLFAKRIVAQRAKELYLVDAIAELQDLIPTAKKFAIEALGRNGLDRDMLSIMKADLFPRKLDMSKL